MIEGINQMPMDSTGRNIRVGSKVRFRGQDYRIKAFNQGKGLYGTSTIEFEEEQHTPEVADEITVDLLEY